MILAANAGNAILAVGMDFRFPKVSQFTHQVLRNGLLGNRLKFDLRIGKDLTTLSLRSDYLLRKETAGGGVLIDLGVHALDLILWWLGDYEQVDYHDDAMGGVEANCELRLQLQSGASGVIEVSRTRDLRNTCIISGERAALEVGLWDRMGLLKLNVQDQPITLTRADVEATEDWYDVFRRQFADFADAIRERREPFVPGCEGKRSVELIDDCYSSRQPLPQPWIIRP
jgi:predicted dehydrogenase